MEMLLKKGIGTAKLFFAGITFVRDPLSKNVMASRNVFSVHFPCQQA